MQFKSPYQNVLVLLSIEQSNSNSYCLPESDFSVAVTIDSITNIVFENKIITNEQVIFKQLSALFKKKLEPCVSPNVSSDLVFSHSVKEILKSIADYLINKFQICQKCIQVLSSLTLSKSNLFNTDSFLQNLLHEMKTVFLKQMKILLTKQNIIQQIIEIIKN